MSFFDESDKRFRGLAEFVRAKRAKIASGEFKSGAGQFGRFTGAPKELPTLNGLGLSQYLDSLHVPYEAHARVKRLTGDENINPRVEFDLWLPTLAIAIEDNPAWHLGGKSEIPRVAELDRMKIRIAKEHGINLIVIDPTDRADSFAKAVNAELVPALRAAGIKAYMWDVSPSISKAELKRHARLSK